VDFTECMQMIRLLYISTSRSPLVSAEIDGILRVSRRNNRAVGVTGLLVVGGRRFLQALEGPEAAVLETFERIRADPRHFAVVILSRSAIAERQFGDWSMGYQPGAALGAEASVAADVEALIAPIDNPVVHAYFHQFALQHAA
jgi:hypothetical protein